MVSSNYSYLIIISSDPDLIGEKSSIIDFVSTLS